MRSFLACRLRCWFVHRVSRGPLLGFLAVSLMGSTGCGTDPQEPSGQGATGAGGGASGSAGALAGAGQSGQGGVAGGGGTPTSGGASAGGASGGGGGVAGSGGASGDPIFVTTVMACDTLCQIIKTACPDYNADQCYQTCWLTAAAHRDEQQCQAEYLAQAECYASYVPSDYACTGATPSLAMDMCLDEWNTYLSCAS
jgi:hypothetical protein